MIQEPIQDFYPEELSHCYGCGRNNEYGLHIKTLWDGDETIAVYTPQPYHIAVPGYVYGGLTASLIDCHGTGSAAAAAYRNAGRPPGSLPAFRFVTASLQVEFIRPTPLGSPLTLRGTIVELKERKAVVEVTVSANGELCSRGKVVAVLMPDSMMPKSNQ